MKKYLIVMILVVAGFAGTAHAAQSPIYYTLVTPSTYYVLPGNSVTFEGTGFEPGEEVAIRTEGMTTSTTVANDAGDILTSPLTIPYLSSSHLTYEFVGETSALTDDVQLSVAQVQPWIILSSYYAPAGTTLTIKGYGFAANEPVTVSFGGTSLGSYIANTAGIVSVTTYVPDTGPLTPSVISAVGTSIDTGAKAIFTQSY